MAGGKDHAHARPPTPPPSRQLRLIGHSEPATHARPAISAAVCARVCWGLFSAWPIWKAHVVRRHQVARHAPSISASDHARTPCRSAGLSELHSASTRIKTSSTWTRRVALTFAVPLDAVRDPQGDSRTGPRRVTKIPTTLRPLPPGRLARIGPGIRDRLLCDGPDWRVHGPPAGGPCWACWRPCARRHPAGPARADHVIERETSLVGRPATLYRDAR